MDATRYRESAMKEDSPEELEWFLVALRRHVTTMAKKELCKEAGIAEAHLSQILKGKRKRPSLNVQAAIASALGFKYCDFLNEGRKISDGTEYATKEPTKQESQDMKDKTIHTLTQMLEARDKEIAELR